MRKVFLLVALLVVAVVFVNIPSVKAAWLSGWTYRKSHEIANATDAGTNYQITLNVYAGSGTDSADKVYLNSHCIDFPNDIAFTDNDGATELGHWLQDSNASWAYFWIAVIDDLSENNATIYIYYGKSGQSSSSNGESTFLFFDDFLGDTLNDTKWDVETGTGYAVSSGNLEFWYALPTRALIDADVSFAETYNVQYHVRAKHQDNTPSSSNFLKLHEHGSATNHETAKTWLADDPVKLYARTTNEGTSTDTTVGLGYNPTTFSEQHLTWNSSTVQFYFNGSLVATHTTNIPDNAILPAFLSSTAVNEKTYVDWCFMAKWLSVAPQHGVWGNEESNVHYVTFYFVVGGTLRVDNEDKANGSESGYLDGSIIELCALVEGNDTYTFSNFTYNGNYNYSNPYNLTVSSNLTLWCYFREANFTVANGTTIDDETLVVYMILTVTSVTPVLFGIFLLVTKAMKKRDEDWNFDF